MSNENFQLNVSFDSAYVKKRLAKRQRQIPFALSKGLNLTAEDIREAEVAELHKKFDVRGQWWRPRRRYGINVKPSKKSNLTASVFTRAYWMFDHVHGGRRSLAGKRLAVPQTFAIRRKRTGAIAKPWRPKNIKNTFVTELGGGEGIIFRWNKRRKMKEKMYFLIPSARIRPTFKWYEVGVKTAKRKARRNFNKGIREALRTAK